MINENKIRKAIRKHLFENADGSTDKKLFLANPKYFFETIVHQPGYSKTHSQILKELKEHILNKGAEPMIIINYTLNGLGGDAIFELVSDENEKTRYEFTGTAA